MCLFLGQEQMLAIEPFWKSKTNSVLNAFFHHNLKSYVVETFLHVPFPIHITLGAAPFSSEKFKIQLNRLSFGLDRERELKSTSTLDKNSWNQNLEISLNQIQSLQNQIAGLCSWAKSSPSYERWIRLIMIRHATHTHKIISRFWKHDIQFNKTFPQGQPCLVIY